MKNWDILYLIYLFLKVIYTDNFTIENVIFYLKNLFKFLY